MLLAVLAAVPPSPAQQSPAPHPKPPVLLITSYGSGALPLPSSAAWTVDYLNVYDNGERPNVIVKNQETGILASYQLFKNTSGRPDPAWCRTQIVEPILRPLTGIERRTDTSASLVTSQRTLPLALASYYSPIDAVQTRHELYAFASDVETCFAIELSLVEPTHPAPGSATLQLQTVLSLFRPLPGYQPKAEEYFFTASLFATKNSVFAAPYFKRSLSLLPVTPETLKLRRALTDKLIAASNSSGDSNHARPAAEQAIEDDPTWPINYYGLACADANDDRLEPARLHLQQAFDRRANLPAGQAMPDVIADRCFFRHSKDDAFWSFLVRFR